MTLPYNMGRRLILQKAKEYDDIEDIYASTYLCQSSAIENRPADIFLPSPKATGEDDDLYEEGTNLVGENCKYIYKSVDRHLDFLRPGLRFGGSQSSKCTYYTVEVKIDTVNLPLYKTSQSLDPHVTGTFTIRNLTPVLDKVVTLFEGYVITYDQYPLCSLHWPAEETLDPYMAQRESDCSHWKRFGHFSPGYWSLSERNFGQYNGENTEFMSQRYIYLKWKERFLLDNEDQDNQTLNNIYHLEGASFEGFYYVCLDQVTGSMEGYYYHPACELFQKLELLPTNSEYLNRHSSGFEIA
ncbi:YGR066C [Saccharomyces arboricola H-6]|uniref:YGR066C n=1 Tax=Saccharomyces arboricola (strain H-6 / AS 2.3317 / CBS 10644) TaxID=1160507 RepID=J8LNI2_SACAR|nr:YGR066C [Saccharomyces arboricola H-6]